MKNSFGLSGLIIASILTVFTSGCKEKEVVQPSLTDIDGNVYKMITIGEQTWMAENLRTTKYRNGDPIENITEGSIWSSTVKGAYCFYNNDETANKTEYGALYNSYAVEDSRNIAPEGWHIPTDAEWDILINYLGGDEKAGGKMKESGTLHWLSPNNYGSNSSGFTALPGGSRQGSAGKFNDKGYNGHFWSSTDGGGPGVWNRSLSFFYASVVREGYPKSNGFSVRCVKD